MRHGKRHLASGRVTGALLMAMATMDHPFLYAIRDDETDELLFIGALQDPS
jgi:serine protease inhibitor